MPAEEQLGLTVFQRTDSDNKCAMSFEDELFLKIMEKEIQQDEKNNWVAPLPFKPGLLAPPGDFTGKDLLKGQWRQVQALANEFWSRWRNEYLSTLHPRRKWHSTHRNLQPGDIVLLKQTQAPRNEWPLALVTSTFPSGDGKVRKVEVKTSSHC